MDQNGSKSFSLRLSTAVPVGSSLEGPKDNMNDSISTVGANSTPQEAEDLQNSTDLLETYLDRGQGSRDQDGPEGPPWWMVVHIYGFACLFFMLAFYAFFSGLNIRSQISSRPFMATVNGFLCALGVSRTAALVIEQYHSQQVLPEVASRLIWDVGFPCLLAASVIIQYTFSELSQMSFGPSFLRRRSFLSIVICAHFSTVVITDIISSLETDATQVLVYISQTVFIVWCLFVHVTFLYIGYKVRRMLNDLPSSAFNNGSVDTNTKGIMQLALLARCGNIASSVITSGGQKSAAAPPKIRITDENERTVSYHSETAVTPVEPGESSPCLRRPSDPVTPVRRPLRPTGRRCSESAATGRRAASSSSDRNRSRSCCVTVDPEPLEAICPAPAPAAAAAAAAAAPAARPTRPSRPEQSFSGVNSLSAAGPRGGLLHVGPRDSIMSTDITLQTVLNHIAYINHPATVKMSPKYQVRRILKVTYATALLGALLSASYLAALYGRLPSASVGWLLLQTAARSAEFLMGCCIANITKQPVQRTGSKLRQCR